MRWLVGIGEDSPKIHDASRLAWDAVTALFSPGLIRRRMPRAIERIATARCDLGNVLRTCQQMVWHLAHDEGRLLEDFLLQVY